ncbi:MAG TPA: hypothetical protein VGR01_06800 [Burkholderiales bacterium]|jgi:hypothetical protein|nr:hypothetical protein [Burkholderiales bacterium]HEV8645262.1 hypothetical protein [Burkholderiales bacterium]
MNRAAFLVVLAFLFLCAPVSAEESWKAVKGASLRGLLPGKELGDDVHYAYRFRSDGTFAGTEMGKDVRGTWRVTGDEICWTWSRPRGAEECYTVEKDGAALRMLRGGSEAWYGTLKPARQAPAR